MQALRLLSRVYEIYCGVEIVRYFALNVECSVNIMERLEGKYLVRLEVDWRYDGVINEGNLVVYASENNV